MLVWIDGQYVDEEEATIPLLDRSFLYGDGLFTTLKILDGQPELFEDHMTQFYRQCHELKIKVKKLPKSEVTEFVKKNKATNGIWRLKIIVTGGKSKQRRLEERSGSTIMLLEHYEPTHHIIKLGLFSGIIVTPHSHLKTLSYLARLYISEEAMQKNVDDCLVRSPEGYILETSMANVFWIEKGELFTPDPKLPLLFGITLQQEIKKYSKVHFVKAKVDEIPKEAKLYCCSTLQGVREAVISSF